MSKPNKSFVEFDAAYLEVCNSIREFFRFTRRYEGDELVKSLDDEAYYKRCAENFHKALDHEMKYIKSEYLS